MADDGDDHEVVIRIGTEAELVADVRARLLRDERRSLAMQGRAGRPPAFAPTDKDRMFVASMVAGGVTLASIADVIGVSVHVLAKAFATEIATAGAIATELVSRKMFERAIGDGPQGYAAGALWLSRRSGWREKTEIEHSGGVEMRSIDLSGLSKEERVKLRAMLEARKARAADEQVGE